MITVKPVKGSEDVKVTFTLDEQTADGPVAVVGDFNDWSPFSHVMKKRRSGNRSASITVPAGSEVHFRYLASEGRWFDDDDATEHRADGGILKV